MSVRNQTSLRVKCSYFIVSTLCYWTFSSFHLSTTWFSQRNRKRFHIHWLNWAWVRWPESSGYTFHVEWSHFVSFLILIRFKCSFLSKQVVRDPWTREFIAYEYKGTWSCLFAHVFPRLIFFLNHCIDTFFKSSLSSRVSSYFSSLRKLKQQFD